MHIFIFLYFIITSIESAIVKVCFFLRFHLSWNNSVWCLIRLWKQFLRNRRFIHAEIICIQGIIFIWTGLILFSLMFSLNKSSLKLVVFIYILCILGKHLLILKLYLLLSLQLNLSICVCWFSFSWSSRGCLSLGIFHFWFLFF